MGYRDEQDAALVRVDALEQELAAAREEAALAKAPRVAHWSRPAEVLVVVVALISLIVVGLNAGHMLVVAWGAGLGALWLIFASLGAKSPTVPLLPQASRGEPLTSDQLAGKGHFELPVVCDLAKGHKYFMEARYSQLDLYDDSAYLNLALTLQNADDIEIDSLSVTVSLEDEFGGVVADAMGERNLIDSFGDPPVRNGDTAVVSTMMALDADQLARCRRELSGIAHARVRFASVGIRPKPERYPPSESMRVEYDLEIPAGLTLTFRRRAVELTSTQELIDIEVRNVGARDIERLDLGIRYALKDGGTEDDDITHQLTYKNRPLREGEVRVARVRADIGPRYASHAVHVRSLE